MVRMLTARVQQWLDRERSEDPLLRPVFGLREAHTHGGLALAACGVGVLCGVAGGFMLGLACCLVVFGGGIFFLGRWP